MNRFTGWIQRKIWALLRPEIDGYYPEIVRRAVEGSLTQVIPGSTYLLIVPDAHDAEIDKLRSLLADIPARIVLLTNKDARFVVYSPKVQNG